MTSTNLATYNNNLNINTEETAEIIRIDRKAKRNAQKRKNQFINRFMGGMVTLCSVSGFIATYGGDIDNGGFLLTGIFGLVIAAQKEKIFNFQEVRYECYREE